MIRIALCLVLAGCTCASRPEVPDPAIPPSERRAIDGCELVARDILTFAVYRCDLAHDICFVTSGGNAISCRPRKFDHERKEMP